MHSRDLTFVLPTEEATFKLGESVARIVTVPSVLFLYGEIGVGKTTFARGFLHGLGYLGVVKSPTYTLIEQYSVSVNHTETSAYHLDLYRLRNMDELEALSIREYLAEASIILIEWPELIEQLVPTFALHFAYTEKEGRTVRLSAKNAEGEASLKHFKRQKF